MITHHRFETNWTFVVSSDGFLFNQVLFGGCHIAVIGFVSITFTNLSERKKEREETLVSTHHRLSGFFFVLIVQVECLHRDLAHRRV